MPRGRTPTPFAVGLRSAARVSCVGWAYGLAVRGGLAVSGLAVTGGVVGCAPRLVEPRIDAATPRLLRGSLERASFDELADAMGGADVVLVGEIHGDPVVGLIERRLFEAAPSDMALSLEMLSRDQQPLVEGLRQRQLDVGAFFSERPALSDAMRALVRAALARGVPIVAANAPRAYAKRARTEGFAALESLSDEEAALFEVPSRMPSEAYRQAFGEAMQGHGSHAIDLESYFCAQVLWDATMAASIAELVAEGRSVFHVVGRFHVQHGGGLWELLAESIPPQRIVTIVFVTPEEIADASGSADFLWVVPDRAHPS